MAKKNLYNIFGKMTSQRFFYTPYHSYLLCIVLIDWFFFPHSVGDIALLNCTAVVNTSNESLNEKNPTSDSIHQLAGPELRDELLKLKGRHGRLNC